jgi:hypothetical protein
MPICECLCNHCDYRIEFDCFKSGWPSVCPKCGLETVLYGNNEKFDPERIRELRLIAQANNAIAKEESGIIITGFLLAIFVPYIGLIYGIFVAGRTRFGLGFSIIFASLISGFIWMAVISD